MSGTEAVMQAVRLARYHTGRSHLVQFAGAYHGWWDGVQAGVGNPRPVRDVYTLKEMDDATLRVIASRRDIACVLVNPLQALHPNASAPGDATLVAGDRRAGLRSRGLRPLAAAAARRCARRAAIPLIFDEVFVGFRLARGGAQEYFGVQADLVTYGKTIAGGLPIGVVCGRRDLMRRFREDRPSDVCFARGTFNSHPYVMGAMDAFLTHLDDPEVRAGYDGLTERWDARIGRLNAALAAEQLPVRLANLVVDRDGRLRDAIALPLDVPVLPPGRRPGPELGRQRPPGLQPRLHGRRRRRGLDADPGGGAGDAATTAGGGTSRR